MIMLYSVRVLKTKLKNFQPEYYLNWQDGCFFPCGAGAIKRGGQKTVDRVLALWSVDQKTVGVGLSDHRLQTTKAAPAAALSSVLRLLSGSNITLTSSAFNYILSGKCDQGGVKSRHFPF
jgi:hypothetical protein